MLKRKIYDTLVEWKNRKHKCLLLKGQRQIGKSYILERFGEENYAHVVDIDFSKYPIYKRAFAGNLDVDSITRAIRIYNPQFEFVPGSTLIILDEIQECPRARTSLKFFTQDGRFDVIASGSLLGVDLRKRRKSEDGNDSNNDVGIPEGDDAPLPVGYEEPVVMYSLDFEEFLWANGITGDIIGDIRKAIHDRKEIPEPIHLRMFDLLRDYMLIGGMPEAVQEYVDTHDYVSAFGILDSVLDTAIADINRYNDAVNANKTVECFRSIPVQLAGSNKKFMYSRVNGDGSRKSAEKYFENLLWIKNAGYGNFCYRVESVEPSLLSREDRKQFKVYMSDTGMLLDMYGDSVRRAVFEHDLSVNMGAIVENVVAECLMKSGICPRYYNRNKEVGRMELDFVVELGSELTVIEVKSGRSRTASSLQKVGDLFKVDRRMMFEESNVHVSEDGVEHYPLYAAAFIDEMYEVPRYPPHDEGFWSVLRR